MSVVSHKNIELSFYKYISENIETTYSYAVGYGNMRFNIDPYDMWLTVNFETMGAGAKSFSSVRIDVVSRTIGDDYLVNEVTALDRLREKFTNISTSLYDFSSGSAVLVSDEKLIILNSEGRRTIDRILIDNLRVDDLQNNLRRSSVFLRLMLLTDIVGGWVI